MNALIALIGAGFVVATASFAPRIETASERVAFTHVGACAADSNYQRLAFWIGDWDVLDSAGNRYATQRVHSVLDDCALTADWASGGGNRGYAFFAFDIKSHEWRQMYASNQVPAPMGLKIRRSDPTYTGPGVRFLPTGDDANAATLSRITIRPTDDHRVIEDFEDSNDGGKTWKIVFVGEHRPMKVGERD